MRQRRLRRHAFVCKDEVRESQPCQRVEGRPNTWNPSKDRGKFQWSSLERVVHGTGDVCFARSHKWHEDGMGVADLSLASKTEWNVRASYQDGKEGMERSRIRRDLHHVKRPPLSSVFSQPHPSSLRPSSRVCLSSLKHRFPRFLRHLSRLPSCTWCLGILPMSWKCGVEAIFHIETGHLGPTKDDP